jgi:hypothetical protein
MMMPRESMKTPLPEIELGEPVDSCTVQMMLTIAPRTVLVTTSGLGAGAVVVAGTAAGGF